MPTLHEDDTRQDAISDGVMHAPEVRFRLLSERASAPRYCSEFAAGMDLSACLEEGAEVVIEPGQVKLVSCGFAMALPLGYEAQIRPRSGLATRFGISVPNAPGTIDADYRGEVKVALINLGAGTEAVGAYRITHGMRIAQMVIAPVAHARVRVVESLDVTARGSGGFGSTGTR
jgi:dUTP pyrophosphatase